ncbi:unnamed protein product [Rotaria sordida]|uniref:Methyltransferase FkbM domain-containing protein n=2 Tax=Rotaria sordida TaxID=392033 RepID=A0A813XP29_9BILA|nr:unnamed protein product [Rotaria sordida]
MVSSPSSSSSLAFISFTLPPSRYKMIEMNDRVPTFKMATIDGRKPYADGDQAQATVINSLELVKKCKQDPSLIVVDIGAFLGDFGLYAAACNCQVFFFEVQPRMVDLIRTSISLNNFSTSRVQIIQNAVSDLPSNSQLTFSLSGGTTTISNGTLRISTIRLDDVKWPPQSSILMLKIDVEGFELNALRSAERLFHEKRIHHLIFEYTPWWIDRAPQKDLIPYVEKTLSAKQLFALDRRGKTVYGPLSRDVLNQFHDDHIRRHLQTDIYATFIESNENSTLKVQPYNAHIRPYLLLESKFLAIDQKVDAFTGQLFGGNPAAVCPLDKWLPDSLMQQIAVENNLAETAFYVPNSINGGYDLRWFTPELEMDLCGHATLATAHIIFTEISPMKDEIKFQTKEAGELTVTCQKENALYTLNFPARPAAKANLPDGLLSALCSGKTPIGIYKARDYMLVYENESDVKQLSPNYTALANINDVFGVIATAPGDEVDFVSRYFTPGASIPEDPVTGSAHCSLIPYWYERLDNKNNEENMI